MARFQVGEAEIHRVEELIYALEHDMFGDGRPGASGDPAWLKNLVADHAGWLVPQFYDSEKGNFPLSLHSWVLKAGGLTVVIDPCFGNGKIRGWLPWPQPLDTPFLDRFKATGISPEDVDVVFCTHLHCDHCGWNTRREDGRWVPTFPNARYMFVQREFDRWDVRRPEHQPEEFNAGVFEDSLAPILEAGLAEMIGDRHAISPHLAVEPAYGHTQGHSVVRLTSGGSQALFCGDAIHHPLQIAEPLLRVLGCDDAEMSTRTRLDMLAHCADHDVLLVPAHFTEPHVGRVRRDGETFRFEPGA